MVRPRAIAVGVKPTSAREITLISICLVIFIGFIFSRTISYDFVNYDDHVYVYQNPIIRSGLTAHGIIWAFTHTHARNWHPLTTISHMADSQLFGLNPAGHHFDNVILHAASVVLLFVVLRQMTAAIWRSAFVAAIFAIHPLHVESVAWIAERKDVLSALFFMLTLSAYVHYVRKPSVGRYMMLSVVFAGGLMSKSMLVSVPLVLLLLDYWPLGRCQMSDVRRRKSEVKRSQASDVRRQKSGVGSATFLRLAVEKIPLFALSLVGGLVTFLIQERSAGSIEQLPLSWRLNNAIVSSVIYIWQMVWPVRLAVFYPHPENHLTIWQVALALAFLIAITTLALAWRRRRPYVMVGWFWYLIMLLPVIGIVQIGLQGHADRYTYLPQIGLYLALTWLVADLFASFRYRATASAAASAIVLTTFCACAWKQTSYWQNSQSLWTHALAVTTDNEVAHTNLGMFLLKQGQVDEAISHLQVALQILSKSGQVHYNLSRAIVHCDLASASMRKGLIDEAIMHLRKAVELQPDYADAHYNLGSVLFQKGDTDQAVAEWRATLSINPHDAGAHTALGDALLQKGQLREAIGHYQAALEIEPRSVWPLNHLAWVLSTSDDAEFRNGPRAVEFAQRAVQLTRMENPMFIRTLAAAYSSSGRFSDATEVAARALRLAREQNDADLAHQIEKDIDLYRANLPLRDPALPNLSR
jgi:tetratricopeptide (TPR) repeat protein